RRFRALKLWFVLRSFGLDGLRALVREHVAMARDLAARVRGSDALELAVEPVLNLVSIAHRAGDDATQRLIDAINRDGRFFVSHCRFQGRLVLRVSIGALATKPEHVRAFGDLLLARAAEEQHA
ncbi:MAG: pyridoxal-dependent decarboxylase, partial [bacterium]